MMLHESVRYANERQQLASRSLRWRINQKLGEMAIRTWVGEAMIWRTLGMTRRRHWRNTDLDVKRRAIEDYSAECSIIKVALVRVL